MIGLGLLATPGAGAISVGNAQTVKLLGLTVNKYDVISALVAGVTVIAIGLAVRVHITAGVPGKAQLAFETIVNGISHQIESSIGSKGRRIVPLAMTLFLYILFCNWLEMLPTGHSPQYLPAPTGDVNLTYAMALTVIILVHATWIRTQGLGRYIGHYFRPYKLLFPINLIEEIAKPLTLALRLFGNIFSGGIMLLLIWALFPWFIVPIPDLIWKAFDGLFVAPVQAFIFSLLTILYFETAMSGDH
ncbi:MAG: F0F1 ATP synthase subunit A [Acidimicrobiales bacterium]|jgi:F-type H+-transporting ATPase subunit a